MLKQGRYIFLIAILGSCLSGCIGTIWTGATLAYDRHDVYKKLNDYHLSGEINNSLFKDKVLKRSDCSLDFAVFNGDILLAGHVPSQEFLDEIQRRLNGIHGYRRFYNKITIQQAPSNNIQDSWITGKIRSQIFTDSSIDPDAFKIITVDGTVYLMGDVKRDEADKVIKIARFTLGVQKVVKLLRYFTYETK